MGILGKIGRILAGLEEDDTPSPAPVPARNNKKDLTGLIEEHEAKTRRINDEFASLVNEISDVEGQIRKLFTAYEKASAASRDIYKAQILAAKKKLESFKERRDLLSRNLEKEHLLIQKLKFLKESQGTADDWDTINDLIEDIKDVNLDIQTEDSALDDLEKNRYEKRTKTKTMKADRSVSRPVNRVSDGNARDAEDIELERLRAEIQQPQQKPSAQQEEAPQDPAPQNAGTDPEIQQIMDEL